MIISSPSAAPTDVMTSSPGFAARGIRAAWQD